MRIGSGTRAMLASSDTRGEQRLGDLFAPGHEAVSYSSARELVDRVKYYLAHEDERSEIAAAGHARTLRDHTYIQRMRELVSILEDVTA